MKRLIYASLPVQGQQLFNALPVAVRNLTGYTVDRFKYALDRFLLSVPDEPQIPGYTAVRRADSNSLLDMVKLSATFKLGDRVTPPSDGVVNVIAVSKD